MLARWPVAMVSLSRSGCGEDGEENEVEVEGEVVEDGSAVHMHILYL